MSCPPCPLRKCQGKRGCRCPSKPPPFIYSKTTNGKPTIQEPIPIVKPEFKRSPPLYIGENAPVTLPVTRMKSSPQKPSTKPEHGRVKAITAKLPRSVSKPFATNNEQITDEIDDEHGGDSEVVIPVEDEGEVKPDPRNGSVKIYYNHYKREFPLVNGSISSESIDSEYALTFAFPNCKIHLSTYNPKSFSFEERGLSSAPLQKEGPPGTFLDMRTDILYWVHVEEDKRELDAYHDRLDMKVASLMRSQSSGATTVE